MNENGARLGRALGYRQRGKLAALTGIGAMAVTLIMVLTPAATATSAGLVLTARYPGIETNQNFADVSGCAKLTTAKDWKFSLKTGLGGAADTGSAYACKKSLAGVGTSGYADGGGGFDIAIPFKVPSGTTNVTMNQASKIALTMKESDGVASNTAPAPKCPSTTYTENGSNYDWNYTLSPYGYYYFNNYNESYSYSSPTYSYNYSYSYPYATPPPSPFNLNNTTSEDIYAYSGGSGFCYSQVSLYMDAYADLYDNTNGTYIPYTSSSMLQYTDAYIETYTDIYWQCGYQFYWYGPSNYTYGNFTSSCYSYNTTYSYVDIYQEIGSSFTYTSYSGTNNTQSYAFPSSLSTSSQSWVYTYLPTHKYSLEWDVYFSFDASSTWKKGSASWDFNAATLGNGIKLTSISIT